MNLPANGKNVGITLTPAQHAKLRRLGGSAWVGKMLDAQPDIPSQARGTVQVPEAERFVIACDASKPSIAAARHNVTIRAFHYIRLNYAPMPAVPHTAR